MKFNDLHAMVPAARGPKKHVLSMTPYPKITLKMPGRHQDDTVPVGLDFVVCVDDETMDWTEHQFTHADLFADVAARKDSGKELMALYLNVVQGYDPGKLSLSGTPEMEDCLHPQTFLYAVQCLAVAEHRRYPQHEAKFGGRFLPFRAAAGIAEGLWSAVEAQEKTRKMGRPGVEWLEKDYGTPVLTGQLMGLDSKA